MLFSLLVIGTDGFKHIRRILETLPGAVLEVSCLRWLVQITACSDNRCRTFPARLVSQERKQRENISEHSPQYSKYLSRDDLSSGPEIH